MIQIVSPSSPARTPREIRPSRSRVGFPCPRAALAVLLAVVTAGPAALFAGSRFALGTAFTYQGTLQDAGRAAEGVYDLSFELYDADGATLGRRDRFEVPITGGGFAVELDFGTEVEGRWLEISVRPAGVGAYTTLEPRQRLAGRSVGTCTVDSDVQITGGLQVDSEGTDVGIRVGFGDEVGPTTGGHLQLSGIFGSLRMDQDTLQATDFGGPSRIQLNPFGGPVGINLASPTAPLHLTGGPDAEPDSGGALVIGGTTGGNLAFDGNEIMARNNGAPSTLYLNNDGGEVRVGEDLRVIGTLDIGYQIVTQSETTPFATATCPQGKKVLGGGCYIDDNLISADALILAEPSGSTGWRCFYDDDGGDSHATAYAICARVE